MTHTLYWSVVGDFDLTAREAYDLPPAPAEHGWLVAHMHEDTLRALLRGEAVTVRMVRSGEREEGRHG